MYKSKKKMNSSQSTLNSLYRMTKRNDTMFFSCHLQFQIGYFPVRYHSLKHWNIEIVLNSLSFLYKIFNCHLENRNRWKSLEFVYQRKEQIVQLSFKIISFQDAIWVRKKIYFFVDIFFGIAVLIKKITCLVHRIWVEKPNVEI